MKDRGHKKRQTHENSQPQKNERRQHTRHAAMALPDIAVIQRGQAVRLIDASTRGVLLETDDRLCPGRNVSLRFVTSDREVTLNGYVVRSWVSGLSRSKLVYCTALSFAQDNPVLTNASDPTASEEYASAVIAAKEPALELVAAVKKTANQISQLLGVGL